VVFQNALHDSEVKTRFCVFCEKDYDGDFLGLLHMKWEQQVLLTTH